MCLLVSYLIIRYLIKKQAQFLNLFGPTTTDQDHFTEQLQQQLILKWFYEGLVCLVVYVLGNQ